MHQRIIKIYCVSLTTQPNFVKRNVIFSINTHLIILDTTCDVRMELRSSYIALLSSSSASISSTLNLRINFEHDSPKNDERRDKHTTPYLGALASPSPCMYCTVSNNDCDFASTTTFMNITECANSTHLPSTSMMWWKYEVDNARQSLQ